MSPPTARLSAPARRRKKRLPPDSRLSFTTNQGFFNVNRTSEVTMSHRYDGHSEKTPQAVMAKGLCPECEKPVEPGRAVSHAGGHWPDVIPFRLDTLEARERKALLVEYAVKGHGKEKV